MIEPEQIHQLKRELQAVQVLMLYGLALLNLGTHGELYATLILALLAVWKSFTIKKWKP